MAKDLVAKVAIITGAAGGIGKALVPCQLEGAHRQRIEIERTHDQGCR